MGLLDFLNAKPKIPPFSVCVYGKLPCYREYFHVTLDAAFTPLKNALVEGVEELNRRGVSRPLIDPDRRFFVRMPGQKVDMAGCIWESNDGLRDFPFMMAVPLPKKFRMAEQPVFYASLLALWAYLEDYFANLREQTSDFEVYRRLRGVEHELPPISMQVPELKPVQPAHFRGIVLPNNLEAETRLIRELNFKETPSFMVLPVHRGRRQDDSPVCGYIGFSGILDFRIDYLRKDFSPPPEPEVPKPEAPVMAEAKSEVPVMAEEQASAAVIPTPDPIQDEAEKDYDGEITEELDLDVINAYHEAVEDPSDPEPERLA